MLVIDRTANLISLARVGIAHIDKAVAPIPRRDRLTIHEDRLGEPLILLAHDSQVETQQKNQKQRQCRSPPQRPAQVSDDRSWKLLVTQRESCD